MNAIICEAIRQQRRLEFDYKGNRRVVEPYCHGISTAGNEVLRAVQVAGYSSSGLGGGKLWDVAKITGLQMGETFTPSVPNYNPNDSDMTSIHCNV